MIQSLAVRHRVLFLCFVAAVLLYLDRFCLTYAQRLVQDDLRLSETQAGWMLSAFFWSYALAQVPSGWLTDRYGPRRMLTLYIVLWSLGTVLVGFVHSLLTMIVVRLLIGLAQAGAYPTCAAAVGRWAPLSQRGLASSLVSFGGRLGGGVAPVLTTLLVISCSGRQTPREFTEQELLDPPRLIQQLAFADQAPDPTGRPASQQWALRILQRVVEQADPSERRAWRAAVSPRPIAESWSWFGQRPDPPYVAGQSPAAPAEAVAAALAVLTRAERAPTPLASLDELHGAPVESEGLRLAAQTIWTEAEHRRRQRLVLEAALPGVLRKLYAPGWRPVMWTYGLIGLVAAIAFWRVVRDRPRDHPRITTAELTEIDAGRPPVSPQVVQPPLPWKEILLSRSLWLISLLQFCTNIGWTFLFLQLPRYLEQVHRCSLEQQSWWGLVVSMCGWLGMLAGGWLTDACVRRFGLRRGRAWPLAASRWVMSAAFLALLLQPPLVVAVGLLSLVSLATDLGSPSVWAYNQDVGGRFTATVLGWGNMWGNIGSALSPILLRAALADSPEWFGPESFPWTLPFVLCAASCLLAAFCGLFIDARESIDSEQAAAGS